jgi:hypothetical protein
MATLIHLVSLSMFLHLCCLKSLVLLQGWLCSRRSGAEDRGWSDIVQVFGGRMIERSDDTVCGLHRACGDKEHEFIG